jgi:hypothetical protein
VRTTVHQNFLLRWVRDEQVYEVWQELKALGLGDAGVDEITDVVSCPGTDSCKLGITSSMGLNRAVQARVEEMDVQDPLTKRIHIKMSGCPNGCSQHHIANIGFYGASIKVGEHTIPAYVAHIGGNYEGGEIVYGARLKVRLPAKRVPEAVERWIRMYEAERLDGEEFNAFAERVGSSATRTRSATWPCRWSSAWTPWTTSSTGRRRSRSRSSGARASARSEGDPRAGGGHEKLVVLCSFQKEESVILDELRTPRRTPASSRSTRACCSRDARDVEGFEDRFGLRIDVEDASGAGAVRVPWTGPDHCCGADKVAALERRAGRRGRVDHRHPPRAGPDPRGTELVEDGRQGAGSRSTTRSPCGPSRTCGAASTSATCPTTRCTTRATPPSAARRARCPAPGARAAGPARRRPNAGSTSPERLRDRPRWTPSTSSSASAWASSSG